MRIWYVRLCRWWRPQYDKWKWSAFICRRVGYINTAVVLPLPVVSKRALATNALFLFSASFPRLNVVWTVCVFWFVCWLCGACLCCVWDVCITVWNYFLVCILASDAHVGGFRSTDNYIQGRQRSVLFGWNARLGTYMWHALFGGCVQWHRISLVNWVEIEQLFVLSESERSLLCACFACALSFDCFLFLFVCWHRCEEHVRCSKLLCTRLNKAEPRKT